jgi:hypothetical protein
MTEQEIRELGFTQLAAGLARSALVAQIVRKEAVEALLTDGGEDPAGRQAAINACKRHQNARWWLLHQRKFGVSAAVHWATALGEEVNREMTVGQFPVA